jgi:hypothetical protein
MAKRSSTLARSKKAEREVQQLLFPDTAFVGHAKRPALEDEDVRGVDCEGRLWWGEVKNYDYKNVHKASGPWALLEEAYEQCIDAIERNPHDGQVPRPFAVLRLKNTGIDSPQNLVLYQAKGQLVIVRLSDFASLVRGGQIENESQL